VTAHRLAALAAAALAAFIAGVAATAVVMWFLRDRVRERVRRR